MIAIDSDVAIDILRGVPQAVAWYGTLPSDEVIVLPGFAAMEVLWGTLNTADQKQTEQWLSRCRIVWLDPLLCLKAYQLLADVHLKNAIGVLDVLIAQVAISLNLPLYSLNQKHLTVVPGLKTIRPYIR